MRRFIIFILAICCFSFVACKRDNTDTMESTVDALILQIDPENQTLLVKGTDPNSILGDNCYIDCSEAKIFKLEDNKPVDLSFSDLKVGDNVIADVREVAESYPTQTSTTKVQLVPSRNTMYL